MSPLATILVAMLSTLIGEPAMPGAAASRLAWQPFTIPSGAMKPTLLIGDYVIVRIIGDAPRRGDVVVFRHPVTGEAFIKRLVGLAGDRIQMTSGVLQINGEPAKMEPTAPFEEVYAPQGPQGSPPSCRLADLTPVPGGPCVADRFVETLPGGVPHEVLDLGQSRQDDMGEVTVPPGHLFLMGDHRDNSTDSRFPQTAGGVGFVPEANVVGTAILILGSTAAADPSAIGGWRLDRILRRIE